jgi:transcriptional antiterminator RfaH
MEPETVPVLDAEPTAFPELLLADDAAAPDVSGADGRIWQVVYTMSRREKVLARHLAAESIPFYLPQAEIRKKAPSGKKFTVHQPLFPGYLFLYADPTERVEALKSNAISRFVPVDDPIGLVQDLTRVRRLLESGIPVGLEPKLVAGQRVEIKSGPLRGIIGTVVREGTQHRFVVSVNFLQQGAFVEFDDFDLEPIR